MTGVPRPLHDFAQQGANVDRYIEGGGAGSPPRGNPLLDRDA